MNSKTLMYAVAGIALVLYVRATIANQKKAQGQITVPLNNSNIALWAGQGLTSIAKALSGSGGSTTSTPITGTAWGTPSSSGEGLNSSQVGYNSAQDSALADAELNATQYSPVTTPYTSSYAPSSSGDDYLNQGDSYLAGA